MAKIKCLNCWLERTAMGVFGILLCVVYVSGAGRKTGQTDLETSAECSDEMPQLALTFDDGPSEYTITLSEGLK